MKAYIQNNDIFHLILEDIEPIFGIIETIKIQMSI